jgi:hypothetical protein
MNSTRTSAPTHVLPKAALLEEVELVLFIVYFAIYVLSNASTTYEPSTSPAKHIAIGAIALVSLFAYPVSALRSLLLFLPVMFIYVLGSLVNYALVAAVFALALPAVARTLSIIVARRRLAVIALFLAISLLPALIAVTKLDLDSLWSSQYGRGRLLMGYWHPKEAAASFALPLVLWLLVMRKNVSVVLAMLLPGLLWVVGSRNVALAVFLAIGLWRAPRATKTILAGVAIAGLVLLTAISNYFDLVDELSSARLSVWFEALSDPSGLAEDGLAVGSRLAIDSFYVEVLASGGAAGLMIFSLWAAAFYVALGLLRPRFELARPFFWAILFFAAFDSGIVSTGNMMHVTLWAFAASPLILRRRRWRAFLLLPHHAHARRPAPRALSAHSEGS